MITAVCQGCGDVWQIRNWERIPAGPIFCVECEGPPTVDERVPVYVEVQDLRGRIVEALVLGH